jgi:hypothetical protein
MDDETLIVADDPEMYDEDEDAVIGYAATFHCSEVGTSC